MHDSEHLKRIGTRRRRYTPENIHLLRDKILQNAVLVVLRLRENLKQKIMT